MYTRTLRIGAVGLMGLCAACAWAQYDLGWHVVAAGGGESAGGGLDLVGTVGQTTAGTVSTGGALSLTDGYWAGVAASTTHPGDLNCDGAVNFADINPFVLALSNPAVYQQQFPNCNLMNGDVNGDGAVNFADINPFVALLTGG